LTIPPNSEFHTFLARARIIREDLKGNFSKAEEILQTEDFFEAPNGIPEIKTFTESEIVNLCLDAHFEVLRAKEIKVVTDCLYEIPANTRMLVGLEEKMSEIEDFSSVARHIYLICRKPLHQTRWAEYESRHLHRLSYES